MLFIAMGDKKDKQMILISYNMVNRKGKKIGIVNKTKVSIKQKLNLLPIIQSMHIINSNIGNTAQNGCLKL